MNTKGQVVTNFIWRFLERVGAQLVSFIVSIVLARILDPSLFGSIALINIFITIMSVFIDGGMGLALVQKKDADDLDFSTVFYYNVAFSIVLYIILFIFAPVLANFYKYPQLTNVIRLMGVGLLIAGVKNIQIAYVSRNLIFKKFFFATLGGTIGAAILGIFLAVKGFGVWALVCQGLFNTFVDTIILYITVPWRPKLQFSFNRMKKLFSFGSKLLLSNLINVIYGNLQQLIIGRKYSSTDLAFYNKGDNFPSLLVSNVNTSIDNVLLPVLSKEQDSIEKIKDLTRKAIKVSSFVIFPLMGGLLVCSDKLIITLLTEKWLPCIPYIRLFCIYYALYPIHTANLNAINALGRSGLFLTLEIIKKIIGIVITLSAMYFGVFWMAVGMVILGFISLIINCFPIKRLLNYSFFEQIKDLLPQFIISLIMCAFVYFFGCLPLNTLISLLIQIVIGIFTYLILSKIFIKEMYNYFIQILKSIFGKKRKEIS